MTATASPSSSSSHRRRPPYIGDSDHDILDFITNLAKQVQDAGPAAYGLADDDLARIIAARDAYRLSYTLRNLNRSPSMTARKNAARDEADRISRMYAQLIKNDPDVEAQLKFNAGVRIDSEARRRTMRPMSVPRVSVDQSGMPTNPYQVKVRFSNEEMTTGRLPRQAGITHVILHAEIAPNAKFTGRRSAMRVVAHVTRNPYMLRFDRDLLERFGLLECERFHHAGVALCGQWLNARGEVGPLGPATVFKGLISGGVAATQQAMTPPLSLAA